MATIVTASGSISSMSALIGSDTHRRFNSVKNASETPSYGHAGSVGAGVAAADTADSQRKLAQWKYPSSLNSSTSSSVADSSVSLSSSPEFNSPEMGHQQAWQNTTEAPSCSPLRPLASHRTSPSMPYGHHASASSSSAAGRRAAVSTSSASPLSLLFSLAQKRAISWLYQLAFGLSMLVFFAALAGIGYEPPQSLESLPIATELEARHPAVLVKHQTMDSDRMATAVRPQTSEILPAQDFPVMQDDEEDVAHPRLQAQDWIQDSPDNPALDDAHADHQHHAPGENIFDKGRVMPEDHVAHDHDGFTAELVDGRYQVRELSPEEQLRLEKDLPLDEVQDQDALEAEDQVQQEQDFFQTEEEAAAQAEQTAENVDAIIEEPALVEDGEELNREELEEQRFAEQQQQQQQQQQRRVRRKLH